MTRWRNAMLVRHFMTRNPITVTPDTPVPEALKLMKERNFRRLPILEKGRLVGIVTEMDLKKAMPSQATTLSIWELLYLLPSITVGSVMSSPVRTVAGDEPMEEAAILMERHKIGGLPVTENGQLVGIITVTDVLRAFLELLGLSEETAARPVSASGQ